MKKRAVRHIVMDHMFNLRDLGGYETADGRMTGWHRLFRGDGPSAMTPEEWEKLKELGLCMVVDLRSSSERKMQPVHVVDGIEYRPCPLQREDLELGKGADSAQNAFRRSLTEGYLSIVNQEADLLTAALKTVKEGLEKGAVLFHCSAGKDRTGVLAAVLLYLCGVSREDIIADYQVSCTYNERGINAAFAGLPDFERFRPLLNSNAENMVQLLAHFELVDIREVLRKNGLADEEMEELVGRIVVEE